MAFQFALAPLLRLRRSLEHQCALELEKASFNLASAEQTLISFDQFLSESAHADSHSLAAGCVAAELHFANLLREQLNRVRVQLQDRIADLHTIRRRMAINYARALHAREGLESLRNQHWQAHQKEEARRQQKEMDTAHILRSWHRRQG
jgi:flagellar export protein FliJ